MDGPCFTVERFGWGAPDRLEVAGIFSGVAAEEAGGAVLTVVGDDGEHRLPAIDHGDDEPPAEGAHWEAEFAWLEAPVAIESARLELGTSLAVELPAPGEDAGGDALAVEVLDAPAEPPVRAAGDAAERLRLETELLDLAEQLEEARDAAQRTEAALERAESDLAAEREARAADAERFRDGLAQVRESAEQAIAAAHGELDPLRAELDDARDALAAARTDAKALVDRLTRRR